MEGFGFYPRIQPPYARSLVSLKASQHSAREIRPCTVSTTLHAARENEEVGAVSASVLEGIKYDSNGALHVYFYFMGPSELLGILYIVNVLNWSLLILHTSSGSRIFHLLIRDDYFQHVGLLRFRSLVPTNLGWDCLVVVVGAISHPSESQSNIFGLIEV